MPKGPRLLLTLLLVRWEWESILLSPLQGHPQLLCYLPSPRNCGQADLGPPGSPGPAGRQERGMQGRRGRWSTQQVTL